jgi:hypothetical protein
VIQIWQTQAALADRLCFLTPGYIVAFKRLDRFRGMVLHTLENYDTAAVRSFNMRVQYAEVIADRQCGDLILNQQLDGLIEAFLNLADAHHPRIAVHNAAFNDGLSKEMRLARCSAATRALVTSVFN